MASTIYSYNLTGGRVFPVAFEYLARRFVSITLIGATRLELQLNVDYRFISKTEIETTVVWTPGEYQTIEVRRVTSATDRLVNFTDGSILRSQDLNISQIQAIHIAEEGRDVADSALINNSTFWDGLGLPIKNIGYPVDVTDAATLGYVEDRLESTVRVNPSESLLELPGVATRRNKVMGFDSNGNPVPLIPSAGTSLELQLDLANTTDPLKGAHMIGINATGETLDAALNRGFPAIRLDRASTSWAKISSPDISYDRADDFANLCDMKSVIDVDTEFAVNKRVTTLKKGLFIQGAPTGMILNGPSMATQSMLVIKGTGSKVFHLNMDNPLMLKSPTGGRQTAINIQADEVTVGFCHLNKMLHSICTEANGEWYMPTYTHNLATNCLGVGSGPSDNGSSGIGEDRGDAFLIWGATGKMLFNRAFCMEGQDARIAFHCESLGKDYLTKPYDPLRDGHDYLMIGNYARGSFRRHFVFEAVRRAMMTNNTSAGGATWWPVCITGGRDIIISNLDLFYDRMPGNNAGAAWAPDRGGFMIGQGVENVDISHVLIKFAEGAAGYGVTSLIAPKVAKGIRMNSVWVEKPVGGGGIAFALDKLPDAILTDCGVTGAQHGVTTFGASDNHINNFIARDLSGTAFKFAGGGGSLARIHVTGGHVERVARVAEATNMTDVFLDGVGSKTVSGTHIEQFGTSGTLMIRNMVDEDGAGKIVGLGSPFTLNQKRTVTGNVGYNTDVRYTQECFTNPASALNTIGKYQGKTVMSQAGVTYIALGSLPASPWGAVTTTALTPA